MCTENEEVVRDKQRNSFSTTNLQPIVNFSGLTDSFEVW